MSQQPDSAPALVAYFYDQIGINSPNFPREAKQIYNLLKKETPNTIRYTLDYMILKGEMNLKFLTNSVQEAKLDVQYKEQLNEKGTAAYLVNKFYTGKNQEINPKTFITDVKRVESNMKLFSYGKVEKAINILINNEKSVLNFLDNTMSNIDNIKSKSKPKPSIKDNPCFIDQSILDIYRDELKGGRTNFKIIQEKFNEAKQKQLLNVARVILKDKTFDDKYSAAEWCWKTRFPMDKTAYKLIKNDTQPKYLDMLMMLSDDEKVEKFKKAYLKWLERQENEFDESKRCS